MPDFQSSFAYIALSLIRGEGTLGRCSTVAVLAVSLGEESGGTIDERIGCRSIRVYFARLRCKRHVKLDDMTKS